MTKREFKTKFRKAIKGKELGRFQLFKENGEPCCAMGHFLAQEGISSSDVMEPGGFEMSDSHINGLAGIKNEWANSIMQANDSVCLTSRHESILNALVGL